MSHLSLPFESRYWPLKKLFAVYERSIREPEDIRVKSLNDEQMRDLNRLKAWLYQKGTTVRLERAS